MRSWGLKPRGLGIFARYGGACDFSEPVKRGGNGSGGGGNGSNGSVSVSGGVGGVGVGVGDDDRVDNDGRRQQVRALFNFASFKETKLLANEASADKLISVVEHALSDWRTRPAHME